MYEMERSKEALDKFRSLPPDRGCFAQQVAQSSILVAWTVVLDHAADADQVTRTEFERLTKLLPERPHCMTVDRYINLIDFARAVGTEDKVAELNRVRDRVRRRIESENDLSAAVQYVKQILKANLSIASLIVTDDPLTPMLDELADEIESCSQHAEKLIDIDSPRSEQNLVYLRGRKDAFLRDVDRTIKRREDMRQLHVIHSKLLGTTCPEIDGNWLQKSQSNPGPALGSVTLLDFWSTTCGPCIKAFPKISALQTRLGTKGLRIVGIAPLTESSWSDKESHFLYRPDADEQGRLNAMKKFTEYCDVNYDQVVDIDGSVFKAFEIASLPTYVVVGRDQKVKWIGEGGDAEFELLVERLEAELGSLKSVDSKPE